MVKELQLAYYESGQRTQPMSNHERADTYRLLNAWHRETDLSLCSQQSQTTKAMTKEHEKALLALFGEDTEETTEQTATEQNTEVAEETTTEQTEEESADDAEEETEESAETENSETKEPKKLSAYEQIVLNEMNRRVADGDELLATAMQSADKDIHSCWSYITAQARKQAVGNCAMIEDDKVFGWAHHYYIESKETIDAEMKVKTAPKEKTAEQKKAEETKKKVYENPLLSALMKKGAKIANDGEVAVVKTTEKKDAEGNVLSSKTTKTDAQGNRTTTLTKNGQTFTMTELSLF